MAIKLANKRETKGFLKNIEERARRKRNPFRIVFELTYRCNFQCLYCYLSESHKKERELNTRQIFSILDQLKDMKVYSIGFTGGEPLVRKDIFDILDYTNRCGFRFALLTNGYLIDRKTAQRLKAVNVDKIEITFNAMTPQTFDSFTRVEGSFEKVMRVVRILREKDIQVAIKSTCMTLNKDEILRISQFARELNIPYRIDGEILPFRNGCDVWVDRLALSEKEADIIRKKVYPELFKNKGKRRKARRRGRRKDRMFNCGVGVNSFSINPCGKMNFCLEIDYPRHDILSQGAAIGWKRIKAEVDRLNNVEDFVCGDCDLLVSCGWCPGRSYMETGSFNNCSEFFRKRAVEQRMRTRKRSLSKAALDAKVALRR